MIENFQLIWALCMFMDGQLIEHTHQKSMVDCLKAKRVASRTIGNAGDLERVNFACGQVTADIEHIKEEGQTAGRIRILKIHERDYEKAYKQ